MCSIALVAACLVCASHAHKVQTGNFQQQVKQIRETGDVPDLKTLATLLLASSPRSAFTLSGPGAQPVIAHRNARVEMSSKKKKNKKVSSNPATKQTQPDPLQAAQAELMQNQKKIAELQGQLSQASPAEVGKSDAILVQGRALRTWSYQTSRIDRVQVVLSSDGRPLDADVQLWQGPDNTPTKMRVYSEDGNARPFSAVIATPDTSESTVAVRNIGQLEFPFSAYVTANDVDEPIANFRETSTIVQGGALKTWDFDPAVESVEIMIKTDGRPLNSRIELLQGPNNNKQVIELYAEDGLERPFFAIFDTVGTGHVIRVVNTAPLEFPMFASVEPHSINEKISPLDPVLGGTSSIVVG